MVSPKQWGRVGAGKASLFWNERKHSPHLMIDESPVAGVNTGTEREFDPDH